MSRMISGGRWMYRVDLCTVNDRMKFLLCAIALALICLQFFAAECTNVQEVFLTENRHIIRPRMRCPAQTVYYGYACRRFLRLKNTVPESAM